MRAILLFAMIAAAVPRCATTPAGGGSDGGVPLDAPPGRLLSITVGDSIEAALLQERLSLAPVRADGNRLYIEDSVGVRESLRSFGYDITEVNPFDVYVRVVRISIRGKAPESVKEMGLEVINREANHWIVRGSLAQLRAAVAAGFTIAAVRDPEPRPRQVRVLVPSTRQVVELGGLMDIYNVADTKRPVVVEGAAFDAQIDRIRALGFTVEIVPPKRGVE